MAGQTNQLECFLRKAYENWGDREYLFEKKEGKYVSVTFGEFAERVNWLAAYLLDKGFHGKNIGIYGPNSIEWMIADGSIMCYVGCSVGISKDWSYDHVQYGVKKCEISCLIYDERQGENIDKLKAEFPEITFLSVQKDFAECLRQGKEMTKELFALEAKDEDEPAKVVFTGGTTSFPKAVLLSVRNVFSGYKALGRRAPLTEEDVCYLFLPLNHTYGSIYNFLYSLVYGYQIYLTYSITDMAKEMMEIHPTVFSGVPLIFMRFYDASKAMGIGLGTLFGGRMKYLFCGGAKLDAQVRNAYKAEGMYMMNAYALSETSSGFSIDYPGEEDVESVGTLFEDVDAIVIDPDEEGYGELAIKGENVFKGYYGDEEATKAAFNEDGYFLTGDIGCIKNGKVYLRGRKDTRIALPNGENVSVREIEQRVKGLHEGVTAVKLYLHEGMLAADVFVNPISLADDAKLWDSLMGKLNASVSRFERIGKYNIYGSDKLRGKLL
ncbi:MAG: AMP-binding protein [Acetatifactor sp.]|nr:AMP-binding protein [Acetatifactor sp.]